MAKKTKANSYQGFPDGIITQMFKVVSVYNPGLIDFFILNRYGEFIPIVNGQDLVDKDNLKIGRFKYKLTEIEEQTIAMAELLDRENWPEPLKAIFFSVNNYTILPSLRGAVEGMEKFADVFEKKYHFKNKIIKLSNEYASKTTILKYLEHIISNSEEGDDLAIYYSGHAKQLASKRNAEKKIVAICPYDEKNVITESEIYTIINKLKPNRSVSLIFDACYAGGLPESSHFKNPENNANIGKMVWLLACSKQKYSFIYSFKDGFYSCYTYLLTKELQGNKKPKSLEELNIFLTEKLKQLKIDQTPILIGDDELKISPLFGYTQPVDA